MTSESQKIYLMDKLEKVMLDKLSELYTALYHSVGKWQSYRDVIILLYILHVVSHFAKSVMCRIWVVLQQLCSHICLAELYFFFVFCPPAGSPLRGFGQNTKKKSNFTKQMCEQSCWITKQVSIFNLQIRLFAMRLTM